MSTAVKTVLSSADLSRPTAEDAPLFHSFLYGSPYDEPASISFFGLRSWHTRADMLRAVVEGAVFNHSLQADAVRSTFPVSRAGITGGGTLRERPFWSRYPPAAARLRASGA